MSTIAIHGYDRQTSIDAHSHTKGRVVDNKYSRFRGAGLWLTPSLLLYSLELAGRAIYAYHSFAWSNASFRVFFVLFSYAERWRLVLMYSSQRQTDLTPQLHRTTKAWIVQRASPISPLPPLSLYSRFLADMWVFPSCLQRCSLRKDCIGMRCSWIFLSHGWFILHHFASCKLC